jgi:hypothetical protein
MTDVDDTPIEQVRGNSIAEIISDKEPQIVPPEAY